MLLTGGGGGGKKLLFEEYFAAAGGGGGGKGAWCVSCCGLEANSFELFSSCCQKFMKILVNKEKWF